MHFPLSLSLSLSHTKKYTKTLNFRLVVHSILCVLVGETALILSQTLQQMSFLHPFMIYPKPLHLLHQGDLMKEKLSVS